MKTAKRKNANIIKLIIAVLIILLLLIILFANRNRLFKSNQIAQSEYSVTINQITIDISNVISSTPNVPVLGAGMIPIKWDEEVSTWKITTADDTSWYDYANGKYANIMLSDGYYKSELQVGIDVQKQLAKNNKDAYIQEENLGTIFTWVPRLMYKEDRVEYLKNTCMIEYEWTTPSCFIHIEESVNELDLAFTGMWVSKETNTETAISTKNNQMNLEDNVYGLIKNEIVSTITEEEARVIEKLNLKCGNILNETTLTNLQSEEYKQVIKILNTNRYAKIDTYHEISGDTIIFKTIHKDNDIQMILDKDGNIVSTNTSGNATYDLDEDVDLYIFYVIDIEGNIRKHYFTYWPAGKPDLTGFNPDVTFYVTYDEEGNETSVVPIGEEEPEDWYSYNNQMWANIVVRNNGNEAYFVWIPRYMYKLDAENERSIVKFVSLENVDLDTGKELGLKEDGYELPEAFTWNGKQLKGYWMSKYQLGEGITSLTATIATGTSTVKISNIVNKTDKVVSTYEAYLIKDGVRIAGGTVANGEYIFENIDYGNYTVFIAGKEESGNQVVSYTQSVMLYEIDPPSIVGFVADTTYLVTYDNEGNEYTEITLRDVIDDENHINSDGTVTTEGKIDKNKVNQKLSGTGKTWYDYSKQMWANIVTRNNDKEAYFVWIPRYEYMLDSANERSKVILIPVTKETADDGYEIPEAFTWNGEAISGYWMSKYQLGT